ncbi:hypothetical protein AcW1_003410 [Taiwanofungus camphoratus]|nr:hypothetical protein AcV5_002141 [Antrodia cinnamomea]KAI0941538.1 hypothetical protein AcW1_003410 [Antrodia cinnamomea]KAI0943969.1 hypothetical protein AcV7_001911 [Antrodia cinnamomea]KAI0943979.1 hypothetical protein AcV7_001918 [Antrodia cinnamomea]KAI0943987.1 hypothetical protein AcV7_001926 [Antrodia cinnamomea]
MLEEVDTEPPLEAPGGEKDWTQLRDMPPPESKGRGRAGTVASKCRFDRSKCWHHYCRSNSFCSDDAASYTAVSFLRVRPCRERADADRISPVLPPNRRRLRTRQISSPRKYLPEEYAHEKLCVLVVGDMSHETPRDYASSTAASSSHHFGIWDRRQHRIKQHLLRE